MNNRTFRSAAISLAFNMAFSAYNIILGARERSWWLLTIGSYYVILSIMRFIVLLSKQDHGDFLKRFSGIMLMIMTVPLIGTVILASIKDRGTNFHEIAMIAIAAYAFTRITLATIDLIRSRKNESAKIKTLRHISFADALVSILSLQRAMLVSFEGMNEFEIKIMNMSTGIFVCIVVFLLGLNLCRKKVFDLQK